MVVNVYTYLCQAVTPTPTYTQQVSTSILATEGGWNNHMTAHPKCKSELKVSKNITAILRIEIKLFDFKILILLTFNKQAKMSAFPFYIWAGKHHSVW